jgi:acyl-CoA-binding protein
MAPKLKEYTINDFKLCLNVALRVICFLKNAMPTKIESIEKMFEMAKLAIQTVSNLKDVPEHWTETSPKQKQATYCFFKQATKGPCEKAEPEWWNSSARFKYSAWKRLGNMPKHEAKIGYINVTIEILERFDSLSQQELSMHMQRLDSQIKRDELQKQISNLKDILQYLLTIRNTKQDPAEICIEPAPENTNAGSELTNNESSTRKKLVAIIKKDIPRIANNGYFILRLSIFRWIIVIAILLAIWNRRGKLGQTIIRLLQKM